MKTELHVILYRPEIPQNTGNIARSCAALGAKLHLVHPLGFSLDDRYLKRAGLDYWEYVDIKEYKGWQECITALPDIEFIYFSAKAEKTYLEIDYPSQLALVFGPESTGLPDEITEMNQSSLVCLPHRKEIRSLNLATACGIALYKAAESIGVFQSPSLLSKHH